MAKTLIVGDVHLKTAPVLGRVDSVLAEYPRINRIVFTGDICDDWNATDAGTMIALEEFTAWVTEQRAGGLQVDVLFGNHDFQYLLGRPGPGTNMDLLYFTRQQLIPLGLRAATTVDGFLVTHAGLTQTFAIRYLNAPKTANAAADAINALLDAGTLDAWEALFSCGQGRGGHDTPGPLWADKWELEGNPAEGIPQIVGHTPVPTVTRGAQRHVPNAPELWFVDTFSFRSDLLPIGDGTMLLVEDGVGRPV